MLPVVGGVCPRCWGCLPPLLGVFAPVVAPGAGRGCALPPLLRRAPGVVAPCPRRWRWALGVVAPCPRRWAWLRLAPAVGAGRGCPPVLGGSGGAFLGGASLRISILFFSLPWLFF